MLLVCNRSILLEKESKIHIVSIRSNKKGSRKRNSKSKVTGKQLTLCLQLHHTNDIRQVHFVYAATTEIPISFKNKLFVLITW
jgi:hypothetical protein